MIMPYCKHFIHFDVCKKHGCIVDFPVDDGVCLHFAKDTDVLTNADRIRAMSDEELAEFLRWDVCVKIKGDNRMCSGWCDECVLEWLKQPAEGE
jgi:hypothetical protein